MRTCILIYVILFISSCIESPYPGYSKSGYFFYKIHQLGEDDPVSSGNYAKAYLMISSLKGDTIHYVPNYPYYLKIGKEKVDQIFTTFHLGDSVSVILSQSDLKKYFNFFHLSDVNEYKAILYLRISEIYTSESEAAEEKRRFMENRSLEQQKELMKIIENNQDKIVEVNGIYREIIETGDSNTTTTIGYGSTVDIHYKGRFTSGYVFDDTYERNQPLSFTYGKQQQVLKGVDIGIKDMKLGNKFKIYIPSQLGFGTKGSLAGIVPPNTSIIYEIEIINVRNR